MSEPELDLKAYFPDIREVGPAAAFVWLRAGVDDLRGAPVPSLFYGAVIALMGAALVELAGHGAIQIGLLTGFLIVGPFLAIGLYDISRRRQRGERVALAPTLTAWRPNLGSIGFYAVILALLLAVWIRVSVVVVALFFTGGVPRMETILADIMATQDGWFFAAAYLAAGAGFALLVFATSVVSLPMLMDREHSDAVSAMITSVNAVRKNFAPILLWGALIVLLTALGFASFFVGLVVVIPVIGHATWHAYRELVC